MANWRSLTCLLLAISLLIVLSSGCGDLDTEISSLTISPTSSTVGINRSQVFTAVGKNSLGFVVDIDPIWSVSGNVGTISSSGLFVAGDTAGSGTVTASYGDSSVSATVTVTENGWLTGQVVDANTSQPISNAVVTVEDPVDPGFAAEEYTTASGTYTFTYPLATGDYTFQVDAYAYFSHGPVTISVTEGATTTVDVTLNTGRPSLTPGSVSVTATLGTLETFTLTLVNNGTGNSTFFLSDIPLESPFFGTTRPAPSPANRADILAAAF